MPDDAEAFVGIGHTDRQSGDEHAALTALTRPDRHRGKQLEAVLVFPALVEQVAESGRYGSDQQIVDGAAVGMRRPSKLSDRVPHNRQVPPVTDRTGE